MIGMRMGLAAVLAAASTQALAADKPGRQQDWVGTWGYVSAPLPPGAAQPAAAPGPPTAPVPAAIPLGPPPSPPTPRPAAAPAAAPQILIENPGNVPVQFATPDLSNVPVRQIVGI